MNTALIVFGGLLAFASIGSAIAKIKKVPDVMKSMESVGVKASQVPVLAALEIAGGLGLIMGIWIPNLGTLATACLSLYFAGAVFAHLSNKHNVKEFGPAFGILIVSVVTTYLQFMR
jgi:uncharacterized membrane protein YphA (DoxX/SURF4 family)